MLFKQLIEAFDIIDSKNVNGNSVASYLKSIKQDADIQVYPLVGPKGSTDMLKFASRVFTERLPEAMLRQLDFLGD